VLLRHGRTADNRDGRFQGQLDTPLDDLGREQARTAARALALAEPCALLTSGLSRAHDTARALGEAFGLEPQVDPRLAELDLGSWQGLTAVEAAQQFPAEHAAWRAGEDVRRGTGETYREAGERAAACLGEHLAAVPPGRTLVAVTHGGTARAALGVLLELPPPSWGRLVALGNCCWSVLVEADIGWRLEVHNASVAPVPLAASRPL
jgi:broad specificity phosphatase PhoE